jgi:hypothetical protein
MSSSNAAWNGKVIGVKPLVVVQSIQFGVWRGFRQGSGLRQRLSRQPRARGRGQENPLWFAPLVRLLRVLLHLGALLLLHLGALLLAHLLALQELLQFFGSNLVVIGRVEYVNHRHEPFNMFRVGVRRVGDFCQDENAFIVIASVDSVSELVHSKTGNAKVAVRKTVAHAARKKVAHHNHNDNVIY